MALRLLGVIVLAANLWMLDDTMIRLAPLRMMDGLGWRAGIIRCTGLLVLLPVGPLIMIDVPHASFWLTVCLAAGLTRLHVADHTDG